MRTFGDGLLDLADPACVVLQPKDTRLEPRLLAHYKDVRE